MALAEVALGNFNGRMPTKTFRSRRFASPAIEILEPTESDIDRKFVVWGFFLGILYMIGRHPNQFHLTFITLFHHDREVGGIAFGLSRPAIDQILASRANGTQPAISRLVPSAHSTIVTNPTDLAGDTSPSFAPLNEPRLSVDFHPFGAPLERVAIFMTIIDALAEIASLSARVSIHQTWSSRIAGVPCRFVTYPTTPLRTRAPTYEFGTLIGSLAGATEWFFANRAWRNLRMVIKLDDVVVGKSFFVGVPELEGLDRAGSNDA